MNQPRRPRSHPVRSPPPTRHPGDATRGSADVALQPHVRAPATEDMRPASTGCDPTPTAMASDADGSGAPSGSGVSPSPTSSPAATPPIQHQCPHTRAQTGIRKPKQYTDSTIRYGLCVIVETTSVSDALRDQNWKNAMDVEYMALMKNNTWHLVPPDHGHDVIDCKWVFKVKRKADGTLDKYKA